ncbi:MAG: SEL1-like repeat protein [Clostridia bacterium]|nr:SEL1-like repeat protein [Clostridia bacterium]
MINDLIFKAQQGDAQAQFELARCYYNGDKIEQDYQKALDWFKKSAEQGHAEAQFEFGLCYYDGCLVKQDAKKAVEWLEKSAEQGFAKAQSLLGICFEDGTGVAEDAEKALYWYTKAADQGDVDALYNLALFYNGGIVENDDQKAMYHLQKAIDSGDADIQYRAAYWFERGVATKQDYAKMISLLEKSAQQGFKKAQASLEFFAKVKGKSFDLKGTSESQVVADSCGEVTDVDDLIAKSIFGNPDSAGHINLNTNVVSPDVFANDNSDLCLLLDKTADEIKSIVHACRVVITDPEQSDFKFMQIVDAPKSKDLSGCKYLYGGNAIRFMLEQIDLHKEIANCKQSGNSAKLNALLRLQQCNGNLHQYVPRVLPVCPLGLRKGVSKDGETAFSVLQILYADVVNSLLRIKTLTEMDAPLLILVNEQLMLQRRAEEVLNYKFYA